MKIHRLLCRPADSMRLPCLQGACLQISWRNFLKSRAFFLMLLLILGQLSPEEIKSSVSFASEHEEAKASSHVGGTSGPDNEDEEIPRRRARIVSPQIKSAQGDELTTYQLQAGDQVVVTVEGYPEYSKERVPIPIQPDGYISYPLIGVIKATGLTISELEARMQAAFTAQLPVQKHARVFVTLMQPKRTILVLGAVEPRGRGNPHVFETGQVYLMHALAAAGINYELADLTAITIWRDGKLHQKVDFIALIEAGGPDIPLRDYDTIIVPSAFEQRPIRVIGAVMAPGVYPISTPQIPAIQALKLAGGSRADFTDLSKAEIITNEGRISIDLTSPDTVGAVSNRASAHAMLAPGDTLYIPLAEAKISVIGAVDKPGEYVITEPVLLAKAVAMAGGLNEDRANPKKCILTRANGTTEELNFDEMHSKVYLHPNDQLRVRERMRIDWRVLTFAASLTSLLVNVLGLRN